MKLYYKSGTCALASHILLNELGLVFDLESVDFATKKTATGENYFKINPKGLVPALQLSDGDILTENGIILQFFADLKPEAHFLPEFGTR